MNIRHSVRVAALSLASAAVAASAALAVAAPAGASTVADSSQTVTQVVSPQHGPHDGWQCCGWFYDRRVCRDYGVRKADPARWRDSRCDHSRQWNRHEHEYRYYWKLYYQDG